MSESSRFTPRQLSAIYRCEGCGELVVGRDIVDDGHGRTEWDADHYARPVLCGPVSNTPEEV